jgi:hypothetical protein
MRLQGIACAFVGHRWVAPADVNEAYPVFECARCGRRREFAPGTQHAGFDARVGVETQRDKSRIG